MNELIIALLTYNRPQSAVNLLQAIEPIATGFSEVELLIIENFSSSTIDISSINNFQVSYFLKKPNRGLDNSIIQALYYAKSKKKYIWFLCDDDNINISNLPGILNNLISTSSPLIYVPWLAPNGSLPAVHTSLDAYKRMSFLPTIACDPDKVNLSKLRTLVGSNYLHVGLLNLFFNLNSEISLLDEAAGLQSRNYTSRFPVFNTFVKGYKKALEFNPILSTSEISHLIYSRTYSSLSFFNYQRMDFRTFFNYLSFSLFESRVNLIKKTKLCFKLIYLKCFL